MACNCNNHRSNAPFQCGAHPYVGLIGIANAAETLRGRPTLMRDSSAPEKDDMVSFLKIKFLKAFESTREELFAMESVAAGSGWAPPRGFVAKGTRLIEDLSSRGIRSERDLSGMQRQINDFLKENVRPDIQSFVATSDVLSRLRSVLEEEKAYQGIQFSTNPDQLCVNFCATIVLGTMGAALTIALTTGPLAPLTIITLIVLILLSIFACVLFCSLAKDIVVGGGPIGFGTPLFCVGTIETATGIPVSRYKAGKKVCLPCPEDRVCETTQTVRVQNTATDSREPSAPTIDITVSMDAERCSKCPKGATKIRFVKK